MEREKLRGWAKAERGRVKQLAELLGISPDQVSKSIDDKNTRQFSGEEALKLRDFFDRETPVSDKRPTRTIPVLGKVPAGDLREAMRDATQTLTLPADSTPIGSYALIVDGDSMDLIAPDGGEIVVDPSDLDLFDGRLYVVIAPGGDTTFKRYRERPARLEPVSSNGRHKPIPVLNSGFEVVGRVVSVTTRY